MSNISWIISKFNKIYDKLYFILYKWKSIYHAIVLKVVCLTMYVPSWPLRSSRLWNSFLTYFHVRSEKCCDRVKRQSCRESENISYCSHWKQIVGIIEESYIIIALMHLTSKLFKCQPRFSNIDCMSTTYNEKKSIRARSSSALLPFYSSNWRACFIRQEQCQSNNDILLCLANIVHFGTKIKWNSIYYTIIVYWDLICLQKLDLLFIRIHYFA